MSLKKNSTENDEKKTFDEMLDDALEKSGFITLGKLIPNPDPDPDENIDKMLAEMGLKRGKKIGEFGIKNGKRFSSFNEPD
jgi:hypothetical protein